MGARSSARLERQAHNLLVGCSNRPGPTKSCQLCCHNQRVANLNSVPKHEISKVDVDRYEAD